MTPFPAPLPHLTPPRTPPRTRAARLPGAWPEGLRLARARGRTQRAPPHFADIDGNPAHYLRFDAGRADTLPLILAHGWPGSVLEPVPLARRLAEPSGHGGTFRDAFTAAAGTSRARARSHRTPLSRTPPPGCSPGSWRSTAPGRTAAGSRGRG
ncbi:MULTISPECIES: epoxide hydrolase N-terminal domain-containing protein [Streptomyces]|uniref:epoxide hydrolase N-terminal domain-containing protein n=1 Tax=Streptomyces TaxID=1883 RepID=UPI000996E053|nr:hypothetical protein [Streptomyces sp. SID4926]